MLLMTGKWPWLNIFFRHCHEFVLPSSQELIKGPYHQIDAIGCILDFLLICGKVAKQVAANSKYRMITEVRRQLTLFLGDHAKVIEDIRAGFNPVQFRLIPAHVTLCRENEIEPLKNLIPNLRSIKWSKPLKIEFDQIKRFAGGKGVLIPAKSHNPDFDKLRGIALNGLHKLPEKFQAHITLMHPRNSTCTDDIFDHLKEFKLPAELHFDRISLIEQRNGGKWSVIEQF